MYSLCDMLDIEKIACLQCEEMEGAEPENGMKKAMGNDPRKPTGGGGQDKVTPRPRKP